MEDVIFLIFGGWLDLTENERFLRKLFKIRNDQHYNTKLFCSQKVFPKPTICLIKHKIESENQIFGSRLLNRNMTTSIIKPLDIPKYGNTVYLKVACLFAVKSCVESVRKLF